MSFKTILGGSREEKLSMLYGALWYAAILSFVGWYLYRVAHRIFYDFGEQTPLFIAVMAVYFILDHFRQKTAVFCRNFFIRRKEPSVHRRYSGVPVLGLRRPLAYTVSTNHFNGEG